LFRQEEPQEPAPSAPKYNLMEETYGRNWAKTASDEYLPSSDCTVGILFKIQFVFHTIKLKLETCCVLLDHRVRQRETIAAGPSVCHSAHSRPIPAPASAQRSAVPVRPS
jgi:hypothetical protein